MPHYDYAPLSGRCERCSGRFEVFQRMAEPPLERCPQCQQPCERLISAVAVTGKYSTSNSKVKELGLTKYQKTSDGHYERTAGSGGPRFIRGPRSE